MQSDWLKKRCRRLVGNNALLKTMWLVAAVEESLCWVAGASWDQDRVKTELDFHDRGGMCVTMSRIVTLLPSCDCVGDTTKNDPISPDNYSQLPKLRTFFSRFQFIFEIKHLVCLLRNECRRLLWFMKIQCGSVENYIWFTAWDGIPALVVRSNYETSFLTEVEFLSQMGLSVSSSKMYFPAWGWVESISSDWWPVWTWSLN